MTWRFRPRSGRNFFNLPSVFELFASFLEQILSGFRLYEFQFTVQKSWISIYHYLQNVGISIYRRNFNLPPSPERENFNLPQSAGYWNFNLPPSPEIRYSADCGKLKFQHSRAEISIFWNCGKLKSTFWGKLKSVFWLQ